MTFRPFPTNRPSAAALLLVGILVVAVALRLHGIDWDSGFGFHPDERSFYLRADCMYDVLTTASGHARCLFEYPSTEPGIPSIGVFLDPERSPLNPHWFPLGSVLIYVLVGIRWVIELFADVSAMDLRFAGRALAAMADVGSVLVVYLLGARMFNRRVGLLAAGLTALAVVHVQTSHFYRPEPFSLVFTLLSFWAMERMVRCRRWRDSLVLGLLVGLAMAPKVSVLPLVVPLGVAFFYWAWLEAERHWAGFTPRILARMVLHATLAGVCAVAVFFVLTPYALLDFPAFVSDLAAQANMAREAGLWPFTIQYVDTPPFLYQLRQTTVWGLGIPLGLVAWLSVPFTAVMIWRGGPTRCQDLLLLAWVVPQFIFLETFEVRFMRYLFPLMPFIILLGARLMVALVDYSPALGFRIGQGVINRTTLPPHVDEIVRKGLPRVAVAFVALVVLTTAFYSLAFQRVYARPHPAVTASDWINENIPVGRKIISDNHWDEFVPRLHRYDLWQFEAYQPDGTAKMSDLAARLAASDYLIFYSQRPFVSVGRASERFPLSANYYRQLFSGDLGYRLERTFTSYPALLGVTFQDSPYAHAGLEPPAPHKGQSPPTIGLGLGYADENVVGYDHPQVLLFKNVDQLPSPVLVARLVGGIYPGEGGGGGLMLSEQDKAKQRAGGTWSELFHRDSWTNKVPLIAWLLVTETFFVLALPFSILVFRFLPDRGIVLARLFGFLVAGYVTWLLVSLGWFEFSKTPIILGLLVLATLSLTALLFRWRETREFFLRNWRTLALGEAIFLGAFLAFALVRAANPDLWHPFRGGEKPMELAYLTAVIRSTTFPPYDPWFSGGYLNYYYWGYFLLSLPTRLTGIVPTTVFNLAVPWFFALTFAAAYSLVYNLASGVNSVREGRSGATPNGRTRSRMTGPRELRARQPGSLWSRALGSPVSAGFLGGSLVAVVGNLDGLVQLVRSAIGCAMNGGSGWMAFDYWRSSRMIPPLDNVPKSPLTWWLPEGTPGVHRRIVPHNRVPLLHVPLRRLARAYDGNPLHLARNRVGSKLRPWIPGRWLGMGYYGGGPDGAGFGCDLGFEQLGLPRLPDPDRWVRRVGCLLIALLPNGEIGAGTVVGVIGRVGQLFRLPTLPREQRDLRCQHCGYQVADTGHQLLGNSWPVSINRRNLPGHPMSSCPTTAAAKLLSRPSTWGAPGPSGVACNRSGDRSRVDLGVGGSPLSVCGRVLERRLIGLSHRFGSTNFGRHPHQPRTRLRVCRRGVGIARACFCHWGWGRLGPD